MEILFQYDTYVNSGFIDAVFIFSLILAIASIIFALVFLHDGEIMFGSILILLSIIFAVSTYLSGSISLEKGTQYEAVITDFNEVYSQGYEIIEQRGKIYVLRKTSESEAK